MNIHNFAALAGLIGPVAQKIAFDTLGPRHRSPYQRHSSKLRIQNEPCPACRVTQNADGRCYNRMCEDFARAVRA